MYQGWLSLSFIAKYRLFGPYRYRLIVIVFWHDMAIKHWGQFQFSTTNNKDKRQSTIVVCRFGVCHFISVSIRKFVVWRLSPLFCRFSPVCRSTSFNSFRLSFKTPNSDDKRQIFRGRSTPVPQIVVRYEIDIKKFWKKYQHVEEIKISISAFSEIFLVHI